MQLIDGSPVYSASDLVGFLECEHLTALERAVLAGLAERPHLDDPELDVLRRRGEEHEKRFLASLEAEGRSMVRVTLDGSATDRGQALRDAARDTVAAMAGGANVIYQATFFTGRWRGHADFLLRVDDPDRPSVFGPYHYEVADTKLARHVKAGAVLQICTYIDLLTALQGVEPRELHVVLGGSAGGLRTLRVADFMAYYRSARSRFEEATAPEAAPAEYPPTTTYPEPVSHCEVCRWRLVCGAQRRADDHLSLVAGISRRQRQALVRRGVTTLTQLAALPLPMTPALDGTSASALTRVRDQARIQAAGRDADTTLYELLLPPAGEPVELNIGLAGLPPPSAGDLFFDIEGDPFAAEDGLEYLFGVMEADGTWHAEWSMDGAGRFNLDGEKLAFERVMDLFRSRLEQDPNAHIYHFAPYEPTALKRLMGRHATREDDVDRLLRGGALIDLYRIVRQGLRASVESYSIKKLEPLYGFTRGIDLRDAGSSIVAFEQFLELPDQARPGADHLDRIEGYNHDDVLSNQRLRDWLEERRAELAGLIGQAVPRPAPGDPEPSAELTEQQAAVAAVAERLTEGVPDMDRTAAQQGRWLLAQLLTWHRREKKSFWWTYFHMVNDLTDAERIEASEPLAGLVYEGVVREEKQSLVHRYRFPKQEYDIAVGDQVRDPATEGNPGRIVALDEARFTIDLMRGRQSLVPHPTALIPYNDFRTPEQEGALLRLGAWVIDHDPDLELDADGPHRAALDLLLHRPPRIGQQPGAGLRRDGEPELDAARRLAGDLDRSTLAIQGPPGSGKTFAGARMALDLVAARKKVGITANSHKVIANFLCKLIEAAEEVHTTVSIVQKVGKDEEGLDHPWVQVVSDNAEVRSALERGSASIAAGTTWLWSRLDMVEAVDVLFVDEAGQMSLANVLAAASGARSLVLLGDPQQLDQPRQGVHPAGADRSGLAHLLGDSTTMPGDLGLFLATTWRLHPDLCTYTSEIFYEGRLRPEPHLRFQALRGPAPTAGAGPRLVRIAHAANDNASAEEAERVATLARGLVESGATWIDQNGAEQPVTWDDVLIVAAYNAQVGAIRERLPEARIGTVDKFQGQEAPLAIYSMASSSVDDAPRGMEFLFSSHRLNVATSRARCVSIVVASPDLLLARARTPEQMRLANALIRFAEVAEVADSAEVAASA